MGILSFKKKVNSGLSNKKATILVSDYMTTKLISFKSDQPIIEVIDTLISNRISGGPVVNDNNELIGIISEGDCMKQISDSRYYNLPISRDNTVGKSMNTKVETISSNMNIFDAASKFLSSKRRRFPVVENGKLIGQISQKDVLKAAIELKGSNWK